MFEVEAKIKVVDNCYFALTAILVLLSCIYEISIIRKVRGHFFHKVLSIGKLEA